VTLPPAELHRLRTLTYGTAVASTVVDGTLVGGWLALRGIDDRARRRRWRALMTVGFSAQAFTGEVLWSTATGSRVLAVENDRRTSTQYAVLGTVASVVLSLVDRRVPRVLARRGDRHPHRTFGTAVGVGYAACVLPIHWARARGRMAALEHLDPDAD
jgi:hypothetical protein